MKKAEKKHLISASDKDLRSKAEEFDNFFRTFIKKKVSKKAEEDLLVFSYGSGFKPMKIEKFLRDK